MPTIKDRSRLCAFTFADGRQCRSLRLSGHPHLCYEHARKEAEAGIAKQAREDLVSLFCGKVLSAPDLAAALGRVLSAVACGYIKPKAASLPCPSRSHLEPIHRARPRRTRQCSRRKCPAQARALLSRPSGPPEPSSQVAPTPQPQHSALPQPIGRNVILHL